jgi:hypothetical protein
VCEEGVIVDAYSFTEAVELASTMLRNAEWSDYGALSYSHIERAGFFMYELGPLHHCNFTEEEEE